MEVCAHKDVTHQRKGHIYKLIGLSTGLVI